MFFKDISFLFELIFENGFAYMSFKTSSNFCFVIPLFSTEGIYEFINDCKFVHSQFCAMFDIYGKLDGGCGETGVVSGFCSTFSM